MIRNHAIALGLVAATLTAMDTAAGPDWNYIEGGYIETDVDSSGDIDGWVVAGSWNFWEWAYLRGSYSQQDEDLKALFQDLELDVTSLGAGGIWRLSDSTDLYGDVSYEDWSVKLGTSGGGNIDDDDTGYRAGFGIRSVVWEGLELNAGAGLLDVGEIVDSEAFYKLGAVYTFGNGIGVGAGYEGVDDFDSWRITLRYAFR